MTRISNFLSRLLKSNRVLAVLSLIVSFILWFNLSQVYNPVSTRDISGVPVTFRVSPSLAADGYEVIKNNDIKVDVTVSGKTAYIASLSASDVKVVANVTGQGVKTWTLDGSDNRNFTVVEMSMSQVTVMTDIFNRDGEIFDVTAKANNVSAPEGLIADAPKVSDTEFSQIKITGAQSVIDEIASVVCEAEVDQLLNESTEFEGSIVLFDHDGKTIDSSHVFLGFDKANITVPILMKKEVPVVATFVNAPKNNPIKATTDIASVVVKGPQKVIEELKSVELEPIDFADITPDATEFTQKIIMPDTITSSDGITEVTVNLNLSGLASRTITVTNDGFNPTNVSQGLTATMESFDVTVIGPSAELRRITADDILVTADLASYNRGVHSGVAVTVQVLNRDSLWVAGKYTADIKQS
ncbi:MAG: hypothetical protein UHZ05_01780 [Acutalibacteraceae bacterium]|nr:hypothetical protein [Acutalibacteraceae bacterium]